MNPEPSENPELRALVSQLLGYAAGMHPQEFKAFFLGGIVTNVVANLPEGYFEELAKTKPCGRPGCDCHIVAQAAEKAVPRTNPTGKYQTVKAKSRKQKAEIAI